MKRKVPPIGKIIALVLSCAALLVSIWSAVQSGRAATEARWSEFRASTLATLNQERRSYNEATCLFYATNRRFGLETFKQAKSHIDELEGSIDHLRNADEHTLASFEARLDASSASFRRLRDANTEFKSRLSSQELKRVAAVCGN